MKLEINVNRTNKTPRLTQGNTTLLITPPIDENYWSYRVKLFEDQAILGFPKFNVIGIGFAIEDDWNCNLPSSKPASYILNHIWHNKKYKEITKKQCIEAIEMIQAEINIEIK